MIGATHARRVGVAVVAALVFGAAEAAAQVWVGSSAPRRGSVEVSGGGLWIAGQDLASPDATLTPNPGTGQGAVGLFDVDAKVKAAFGAQGAVGVYVTPRVMIEGGIRVARPRIEAGLSDDFEGAPAITASSTMTQYIFSGSLLYHFGNSVTSSPFVAVGAGHLRDVHSSNELVETGTEYHAKAGVKMWMGSRRRTGIRLEGGVSLIDGGFRVDEDLRVAPTAAVLISHRF